MKHEPMPWRDIAGILAGILAFLLLMAVCTGLQSKNLSCIALSLPSSDR